MKKNINLLKNNNNNNDDNNFKQKIRENRITY